MDEKLKKRKHAKRAVFWMGVGWGAENGAMLTIQLFSYTSECTIS